MSAFRPLTPNMERTLGMLVRGEDRPKYARGDGGWFMAYWSLFSRGLIDDEGQVTAAGLQQYNLQHDRDHCLDAVIQRCLKDGA